MNFELFAFGFAAGLALAIPVGPMAIMLINTTMARGWRHGSIGAFGMAFTDFSYAFTVFVLGHAVSSFFSQWGSLLSLIGAAILLALGLQTVFKNLRLLGDSPEAVAPARAGKTYLATLAIFIGATIMNPPTALYFLGITPSLTELANDNVWLAAITFAVGVFVGSIIWQEGLALAGIGLRKITGNKIRAIVGSIGGLLIIALAISLAVKALS